MAEITFQDFAKDLAGLKPAPTTGVEPTPPVRFQRAPAPTQDLQRYTPTGEAIPLDEDTGAPWTTRLRMSLTSDEETKKAIAQDAFSGAQVEAVHPTTKLGETKFVIRNYKDPETGQLKDLMMDEKGTSVKDLADLGDTGVNILGAVLALRGGGAAGIGKMAPGFARTAIESLIGSAGGSALTGAVEAQQRYQEGQPIDLGEIAGRKVKETAIGTAVDIGVTAPVVAGTKLLNLRRGIPQTAAALEASQARNRLAEITGIDVPFSLGEAMGSEGMREREQLLRKHILGGGRLEVQKQAQQSALRQMQGEIPGTFGIPAAQLPSKDVVGNEAVSSLRALTAKAEAGTASARAGAVADAMQDLSHSLTAATGIQNRQVLQDEAGNLARNVVNLKHDVLNDIEGQLQAEAKQLGADRPFIPTPQAKQDILNTIKKAYEKPGKAGEPLATTPGSVLKVLEDVQALPAQTTWDELRRVRNSVNRLMSEGQILGDTDTGVLKKVSSTLTDAINRGTETLSPEAGAAVLRANKFYAEGIEQFQVKGVTDILADPTQRKLGPFAIFNQAAKDPDQYFRLKDALTQPLMLEGKVADQASHAAGQNAWSVFKQGMWDEMTDSSVKSANRNMLDPVKLLNKLENMPLRVKEDLLGPQGDTIMRSLKRLEVLDNPKLPATEALEILRQGGDQAPTQIMQLAKREKELDKLYDNQVIKKFTKGEIGSQEIDPEQFIDRFATSGPIADVRDTMNKLEISSPGRTKLVRSKMVQSILTDAAGSEVEIVSAKKLQKEIGSQEAQDRLREVLGEPGLQRLNDFQTLLAHIQHKGDVSTSMGGSMAGGEAKSKMLTVWRAIRSLPAQVQYRVAAAVISNPNLYRMAAAPVQPLDPTKLLRSIIVSDDAIADLVGEYGKEAASVFDTINRDNKPTQSQFQQQLQQRR